MNNMDVQFKHKQRERKENGERKECNERSQLACFDCSSFSGPGVRGENLSLSSDRGLTSVFNTPEHETQADEDMKRK